MKINVNAKHVCAGLALVLAAVDLVKLHTQVPVSDASLIIALVAVGLLCAIRLLSLRSAGIAVLCGVLAGLAIYVINAGIGWAAS